MKLLNYQIEIIKQQKYYANQLFKPEAVFSTSYGYANSDSFQFDHSDDRDFSWAVNVTIPLIDGLSTNALMAEYDAAIAELELAITELRLSIRKDVTEALLDINIAKTHYLSNVERTKLNHDGCRLKFGVK